MKLTSVPSIVFLVLISIVVLHVDAAEVNQVAPTPIGKKCSTPIYNRCQQEKCHQDCLRHFGPGTEGWCWVAEDLCFCDHYCTKPQEASIHS
ncbi:unnamed protein product [Linum tenue]|uniref:Uncharacterized protein n=1 Tax=Linum tenue TaxID=586396 RepID=A0AAV0IRU3_9ROSI|nr:unnamed protein product [Linum tenue]